MAERDRQRLDAVGAARHGRRAVRRGEAIELAADLLEIAQDERVRLLELKHHAGVEDVLGGRAEMQIFAVIAGARRLQGAQRRHKRMLDAADLRRHRHEIDVGDTGLGGDLVGGRMWDDAELGLRAR